MRKLIAVASLCAVALLAGVAQAQQIDAAVGISAVKGPSTTSASGNFFPQTVGGGVFPTVNGDFLFWKKYIGVGAEFSWRATQNSYYGQIPFRPIFWDINAVAAPKLGKKAALDAQAGIGAESARFYTGTVTCSFAGCTNYTSTSHLLVHLGGGVRVYVHHNIFVEPSIHYYHIRNNVEFSGPWAMRAGISVGYTFRAE